MENCIYISTLFVAFRLQAYMVGDFPQLFSNASSPSAAAAAAVCVDDGSQSCLLQQQGALGGGDASLMVAAGSWPLAPELLRPLVLRVVWVLLLTATVYRVHFAYRVFWGFIPLYKFKPDTARLRDGGLAIVEPHLDFPAGHNPHPDLQDPAFNLAKTAMEVGAWVVCGMYEDVRACVRTCVRACVPACVRPCECVKCNRFLFLCLPVRCVSCRVHDCRSDRSSRWPRTTCRKFWPQWFDSTSKRRRGSEGRESANADNASGGFASSERRLPQRGSESLIPLVVVVVILVLVLVIVVVLVVAVVVVVAWFHVRRVLCMGLPRIELSSACMARHHRSISSMSMCVC